MSNVFKLRQLGDVCEILDSKRKPITKRDRVSGPYPYYGATGVLDYVADYIFDEPLVLIGEDGAKWGAGENTAYAVDGKCWVNNHAHVIRPNRDVVLDSWIIYSLNAADLAPFISGLTVPKLNQGRLREIPIPLPPIEEQKHIVAILDEAFAGIETAIANTEKNLANARELLDGYLSKVFKEEASKWPQRQLSGICTFSSGGTPSKKNKRYWDGAIPWISGRDMKSTRLQDSMLHISEDAVEETATRIAPAGSILILVRGMGLAHGAQVAELTAPCAFNQDIRAIHPVPEIFPRYLVFALCQQIDESTDVLSNAAHGTLKIDSEGLRSILIPMPDRETQAAVMARIDRVIIATDELKTNYEAKLASLAELKQSLLQKAFSGELTADRVEEELEPATA